MKSAVRFILLISTFFSFSTWAQGSLEPPGPPGPTMKTLDQVEARIPVSEGATLAVSGSYYLTNNLLETLLITADDVTLDLNGYTIDVSATPTFAGINLNNVSGIQIYNGTVTGGINSGIVGTDVSFVRIHDVFVYDNSVCINLPTPSGDIELVRIHCDSSERELVRIFAEGDEDLTITIRDSTFTHANTLTDENRPAINVFRLGAGPFQAIISNNRVYSNRQGGIQVVGSTGPTSGSIVDNQVHANGSSGIYVVGDFVVARNIAQGNAPNYGLSLAPNSAPVLGLGDSPTAWSNIGE